MSRRSFLIGHLTGLMLGAGLMLACLWQPEKKHSPATPAVRVSFPTTIVQPSDVPPDWQRQDFNGRPVYIIPLTQNTKSPEGNNR